MVICLRLEISQQNVFIKRNFSMWSVCYVPMTKKVSVLPGNKKTNLVPMR